MSAPEHPQCQRWTSKRDSYRPAGEPIDPERYGVEEIEEKTAKGFVVRHHYSGSYPASRTRVGLYRCKPPSKAQLVGVAVFSVPCNQRVVPCYTDLPPEQGVELGRFVLLDDVPANGETFFLARAFRLVRQLLPEVRAVVSYSDPVPRSKLSGELVTPGHVGTIYQAHNGIYQGRSSARTLWLAPDGTTVSPRSLSKIRLGERGQDYAAEQLERAGAPGRKRGESGEAWVTRALESGALRKMRHPGNHVYTWGLYKNIRRKLPESGQYPKRIDYPSDGDQGGLL